MIVGNGFLAKTFKENYEKDTNIIIFASGVSNSNETDQKIFDREKIFLIKCLRKNKKLIYFSTCSVYENSLNHSAYIKHKIFMEDIVKRSADYLIFRLPQIVGNSPNPNTLTNFLYERISRREPFNIYKNCKRNIIDVEDVFKISSFIINSGVNKSTINIASPKSTEIMDLVKIFEGILNVKASYNLLERGESYNIDVTYSLKIANDMNIHFDGFYNERIIRKYYG